LETKAFRTEKNHQEAYKSARTNLMFSLVKEGCKKISIVSSLKGEGKTLTVSNIAYMLAMQMDTKVLIIDCDLRMSRLHKVFGFDCSPGLSDYLIGKKSFKDVLRHTKTPNLSVICAGTIPPNPSELLSGSLFEKLINDIEKDYDYIIFDTAPLNVVIDAYNVVRQSDGVVFTVVQDMSTHDEFAKTIAKVNEIGTKVLGVILHGTERKRNKKYGYGYGYIQ